MDWGRLSEQEQSDLFDRLFPTGLAGPDVQEEVAPGGWEDSALMACFHPSVEQRWREAVRMHRNIESFPWRRGPSRPEPTLEDIRKEHKDTPVEAERELRDLVALCIWDVFSDNHDVIAPDGRQADIGSFRGAAGFIADFLNTKLGTSQYDYMDFYMGTIWLSDRADLTIVFRMIFRRLKREGCDWHYSFPRLGVVDLGPLHDTLKPDDGTPEWAAYSPSASFEREQRQKDEDEKVDELRRVLDEAYRRDVEAARQRPPPLIVEAYRAIFGGYPSGWPPG